VLRGVADAKTARSLPLKSVALRMGIGGETVRRYVRPGRKKYGRRAGGTGEGWACTIEPSRTGASA
jgi:hypothetical protein